MQQSSRKYRQGQQPHRCRWKPAMERPTTRSIQCMLPAFAPVLVALLLCCSGMSSCSKRRPRTNTCPCRAGAARTLLELAYDVWLRWCLLAYELELACDELAFSLDPDIRTDVRKWIKISSYYVYAVDSYSCVHNVCVFFHLVCYCFSFWVN